MVHMNNQIKLLFLLLISQLTYAEDVDYMKAISTPAPVEHTSTCESKMAGFGDYVSGKIVKNLGEMKRFNGLNLLIKIQINQYGEILSTDLMRSSGNDDFDQYVLNNINKAAPFSEYCHPKQPIPAQNRIIIANIAPHEKVITEFDKLTQKCIDNHLNCMSYSSYKIISSLGDLTKFKGLSISLKVVLNTKAVVTKTEITKSSGNSSFDALVKYKLSHATPFSALITSQNRKFKELRTISMSFGPIR